jgi:PAS domain S-box-containing protein
VRQKLWLWSVPFLVALCGALFAVFYRDARQNAVRALNDEQALHARQAAQGIEEFFSGWQRVLASLARIESVAELDADGRKYMALFQESHRDQLRAITRVGADGRILHTVPANPAAVGSDISSQPHVREILREHRPVTSDVFRAVQGYDAVALHVPVFKGETFAGTLAIVVNFEALAERYFAVIRIGAGGHAWVISRDGTMLFSPEPGQTGRNVRELFDGAPGIRALVDRMLRGGRGEMAFTAAARPPGPAAAEQWYAVWQPIRVGSTFWSIAVTSPAEEALSPLVAFRNRLALIMALLLACGVLFTYLGVKASIIIREEEKRRRVEQALRESEERFRDLADSLPQTVFEADVAGTLTYVNRAGRETFGLPDGAPVGVNLLELLAPGERDAARANLEKRLRGELAPQEYQAQRRDGSSFPVIAHCSPIQRGAGTAGLRGLVIDISERRQLEEERLKSEKLEAIGVLAGGIAHDFNNLLQGIFGWVEMARRGLEPERPEQAMLRKAEGALEQAVTLTNQLLTFSKGGRPLKRATDLRPVIERVTNFSLSGSRAECRLELDAGLSWVDADEGQIAQVLQNLVLNAAQAMPAGGSLLVSARNVGAPAPGLPAGLAPGEYVQVAVTDSGAGIPPELRERIFDPYFTTKERGSGLGLATSLSIVRNHGGAMTVESEPGRGSRFAFYLPAAAPQSQAAAPRPPAAGKLRPGRILVMDDEEAVRSVAAAMLRYLGQEAVVCAHGDEAIAHYRAARESGRPFDAVLLDLTIRGGLGGEETLDALRAIDPGVKAVVSSGYAESSAIADYRQRGFAGCLRKPFQLEALGSVLRSLQS